MFQPSNAVFFETLKFPNLSIVQYFQFCSTAQTQTFHFNFSKFLCIFFYQNEKKKYKN